MNNSNDTKSTTGMNKTSKKSSLRDKAGEMLEKAGDKISEVSPGIGKKIHDLGDKVETTHENPTHGRDV